MSRRSREAPAPFHEANDRFRDARHEAAHAVVSVRLGLPLESTDILRRIEPYPGRQGLEVLSTGYTTLPEGTAEAWAGQLPDPEARRNLESLAVQCAAGVVAEMAGGGKSNDIAHRTDLESMIQIAGNLGIGMSTDQRAVKDWMQDCVGRAAGALFADNGVAWDRVTDALLGRGHLTGDDVRALAAPRADGS